MSNLNNDITPNRGIELLLSGGKQKKSQPVGIICEKLILLFKKEITIYFELSIKTRKIE